VFGEKGGLEKNRAFAGLAGKFQKKLVPTQCNWAVIGTVARHHIGIIRSPPILSFGARPAQPEQNARPRAEYSGPLCRLDQKAVNPGGPQVNFSRGQPPPLIGPTAMGPQPTGPPPPPPWFTPLLPLFPIDKNTAEPPPSNYPYFSPASRD